MGVRPNRGLTRAWVPLVATATAAASLALSATTSAQAATSHATKPTKYFISLGDSYSVGYQPQPTAGSTKGYTVAVAKKEKLTLENFGCGGATTSSILNYTGVCSATPTQGQYGPPAANNPGPHTTGNTQIQDAVAFIKAHSGQIGLITVSIGGNDVTSCASAADPITCVANAIGAIQTNVTTLANDLASAAGSVPLIGLTYPDVILGQWVYPPVSQTLAEESVTAFQSDINPALSKAYTGAGGAFVDVTSATGAYIPLTQMVTLKPYGKIPKAVAEVCQLTWYCQLGNIHANTKGYGMIATLIEKEYAKLPH